MNELFPTVLMAFLCAMIGGVIGFHVGYATRNPKRKEEYRPLHATHYPVDAPPIQAPTQDESRRFCSAYALYVLLYGKRYNIYRWDDVQCIHFDQEGFLFIRLHSGEELRYTEWRSYGITTICDVIKELNEDIEED